MDYGKDIVHCIEHLEMNQAVCCVSSEKESGFWKVNLCIINRHAEIRNHHLNKKVLKCSALKAWDTHLWSNGEGPETAPVEEHVVPGQEDIVAGSSNESHPPKFALDESKFPPGESGGDGGEWRYAQHHQEARGYGACVEEGRTVRRGW